MTGFATGQPAIDAQHDKGRYRAPFPDPPATLRQSVQRQPLRFWFILTEG
ncbi:hypothetical protein GCM10010961_15720 [Pseudodonghicola xiamenensis]|uniref:Uncharacterized protein n=1 Tax=Pseudodonghicola xiamenensis TaxID=337702 RepID=A0A8J3H6G0_9RHOB|nr:hypothetical protein GCM10010961_15720 [Pseudodonghicola xiamenensis]